MTPTGPDPTARPADSDRHSLLARLTPETVRPFVELARLDRPIGWRLLLLPCWWSSALAATAAGAPWPGPWHLLLFLVGAVAMRGAGSTWNDFIDRELDASVARTRGRPLPSGRVGVKAAAAFAVVLSLVGFAVLVSFNRFTIGLGLLSMLPVAVYPFMKRVTFYPQAVLGLAFAWGAMMGWAALYGALALPPLLLYAGSIAWVIGYDTIYALQDIEDDAVVGIRSTARAYGARTPLFVGACYLVTVLFVTAAVILARPGVFALGGVLAFSLHLRWQIRSVRTDDPARALRLFHSNWEGGLLLFAGLSLESIAGPALYGLMLR